MNEDLSQQQLLNRMTMKSLGAFLLAYFLLYYGSMYTGIVGVSEYGISSVLHINSIDYLISSRDWRIRSVMAGYGFPFLTLVVCGIFSYAMFLLFIRYRLKQLAWFWSWLAVLSSLFIFGSLAAGIIARKGIHFALIFFNYAWNIQGDEYEYMYLIPAVAGLAFTAVICRKIFLELSPSVNLLVEATNARVLFHVMLIPALLGILIIAASHYPDNTVYETLLFISIIVPLLVGTLASNTIRSILIGKYEAEANALLWMIAGLALVVLIRLALADGWQHIVASS